MITLAANILISVSDNNEITTLFTNISKTVFNGDRNYYFRNSTAKLKDLSCIFNDINNRTASVSCLELYEFAGVFYLPGTASKSTDYCISNCSNQSLYCRQIVAAIAYFVECFNEETNSSYFYPIKIKYKDYEMNLNTLEDIITFIKYEG